MCNFTRSERKRIFCEFYHDTQKKYLQGFIECTMPKHHVFFSNFGEGEVRGKVVSHPAECWMKMIPYLQPASQEF